jgi:YD repeat-containing protein
MAEKNVVSGIALAGCVPPLRSRIARRLYVGLLAVILGAGLHLEVRPGSIALSLPTALADDIEYIYDELGRVVQASNRTSGQAVVYDYDAAGNITSQTAVSLTVLSIGHFSPQQGPPGTQVTISGTGFNTTASSNTVRFNGSSATVSSASQTQLAVTVPTGATSGPISVQVGATTVTSSASFTVTSSPNGPVITGLFPSVGSAGQVVTISGTGFEPVAIANRVRFDNTSAQVLQSSPTSITTTVPAAAGSGKVRLTTPRGVATSPMDFIVVPSGYSAGSIGGTGRLPVDGSSTSISLPTARSISVQLFDGNAGDLLTLGVNSMSMGSCTLKVFNPDGTALTSSSGVVVTAAGQGVQLPKLPVTGTYTIVVDPGSATGTIALGIFPPLQQTLIPGAAPAAITLAPPGRRAKLTFAGTAGTYANISLSAVTLAAGTVSVIAPNGGVLDSRTFTTAGTSVAPQLPASGTYTILVDPTGSVGGSFSAAVGMAAVPSLGVDQGTFNLGLTNTTPVNVTFDATAGQYLALEIVENSNSSITGAKITVLNPDGSQLTTGNFSASPCGGGLGCTSPFIGAGLINFGPLTQSGTYTLIVQENTTATGTLALTLSSPVTGSLPLGTTTSVQATERGQAFLQTFTGAADQFLALEIGESGSSGTIPSAVVTIFRPDGTVLTTGSFSATLCGGLGCNSNYLGSAVVNMGPLPESGTYTALIQQTGAGGSGPLAFTVSSAVTGSLTTSVSSDAVVTLPGQSVQETFAGTSGQYLSLAVVEGGSSSTIPGAVITILNPDGSVLKSGALTTTVCNGFGCNGNNTGAAVVNFGPLQETGSYTAIVQQVGAGGSGTLTLTLSAPLSGALAVGASASEQTQQPGQPMQLTFPGATGQYLALAAVESSGLIPGATITVLKPDGTQLTTATLTATNCTGLGCSGAFSGSAIVNMGPLPSTGTYTAIVQQTGASGTGALTMTLSSPLTDTLVANTTPTEQTSLTGQQMLLSFAGSPGQFLSLAVTENNGLIPGATITVLAPDGTQVGTATPFTPTLCSGFGCNNTYAGTALLNVGPLLQTGNYAFLIQQTGAAGTGALTLAHSRPAVGTLTSGSPSGVSTVFLGQAMSATFSGTAGSAVSLTVAESAGSISGANVSVFNPDGTPLATGTLNTTTCSGCGFTGSVNLAPRPLPQTGTYTVLAQQKTAANGALTFSATGVAPTTPTTWNVSDSTAGAIATITFSASQGQSANLVITNLAFTPSSQSALSLQLVRPDGNIQSGSSCSFGPSGCSWALFNFPQTGTYTVRFIPSASLTFSANVALVAASTGTLAPGTPVNLNLSTPGQMGVLSFTAMGGQTEVLNVSGITTTPSGGSIGVQVLNSAGIQVTSTSTTTGATLNLPNLAADTYTVLLSPSTAIASIMQVTLLNGVTGAVPTDGTSSTFTTAEPGQQAYLKFQGTAGQSYSLTVTGLSMTPSSPSSLQFQIVRPDGNNFLFPSCTVGPNGCQFSLFRLPVSGTYSMTLVPNAAQTFSATVKIAQDLNDSLTPGTPYNLSLPAAGANATLNFTAIAGQTMVLNIRGVSSTPANLPYVFTIYNSAGTQVTSTSTATGTTINLPNLAADTYTVLVNTASAATGSMQLLLQQGTTGSVPTDGTANTYATSQPGQTAYLTFQGTAGQTLNLAVTNLVMTPSSPSSVQFQIIRPDGNNFLFPSCSVGPNGCQFTLFRLPLSGTYTMNVVPGQAQTFSATLTLTPVVSTTLTSGTSYNLTLPGTGEGATLNFTATAGQTMVLNISGVTSSPAGLPYVITVYNSAGGQVTSTSTSSGTTINLPNLPADTYTVLVSTASAATGSMQVLVQQGIAATVPVDGNPHSFNTVEPGQIAYLKFQGTAGQSLSLAVTNLSMVPASPASLQLQIIRPDGNNFLFPSCTMGPNGCQFSLFRLPLSGAYTMNLVSAATQTFSATLTMTPDIAATLTPGTPLTVALPTIGQNATLNFTATAGQTMVFNVSGVTSTPAGLPYLFTVYNSAGSQVTSTSTTTGTTINLPNLAADTYTVLVSTASAATGSMQVLVQPGIAATVPTDSTPTTFTTAEPGQIGYLKFQGTAGQSLSLVVTNLSLTPASPGSLQFQIIRPDGNNFLFPSCAVGPNGCEFSLFKLPLTGTYTMNLVPATTQTFSVTLSMVMDVSDTLTPGSPYSLNLSTLGQDAALNFSATAGQTLVLNFSGIASVPAGLPYTVTILNSAGNQVTATASTTGSTLNLPNLAAGTYTVLVTTPSAATATIQFIVQQGIAATTPVDGSSNTYAASEPGQNGYLKFQGTAGQSLNLAVSSLSLTPGTSGSLQFQIIRPDGNNYQFPSCSVSANGCQFSLFRLPLTGLYSMTLVPPTTQTFNTTLSMTPDLTAALTANTPFSLNLPAGQDAALTFTATSGQSVALSISALTTTPANLPFGIQVFNTAGSQLNSASTSTGTTLNLTNLAADTYTVLIHSSNAASGSMQVSYH